MNQIMVDLLKKYVEHPDCRMILDRIGTLEKDCERLRALPAQRRKMEEDAVSELSTLFASEYRTRAQSEALTGNLNGIKRYQEIKYGHFFMPGKNQKGEIEEVPFKIQNFFYL